MGCCFTRLTNAQNATEDDVGVYDANRVEYRRLLRESSIISRYSYEEDKQEQRLSLSVLDDVVLIHIISFLNGPSLLSIMLTCKRLCELGSDSRNWGRAALFSRTVFYLRKALLFSVDPLQRMALTDLMNEAKKLRNSLNVFNANNVKLIWLSYGPVAAKLFCNFKDCSLTERRTISPNAIPDHLTLWEKRWSVVIDLFDGKSMCFSMERTFYRNRLTGEESTVTENICVLIDRHLVARYSSGSELALNEQTKDPRCLQPVADILNNNMGAITPRLNWQFVKLFVQTVIPLFFVDDVNLSLDQNNTDSRILSVWKMEIDEENELPEKEQLAKIVANVHELFWDSFVSKMEKCLLYGQKELSSVIRSGQLSMDCDYSHTLALIQQSQSCKREWRSSIEELINMFIKLLTSLPDEKMNFLQIIVNLTMAIDQYADHKADCLFPYGEKFIFRSVGHKLLTRICAELLPLAWYFHMEERSVKLLLPDGRFLTVVGKVKDNQLCFICPDHRNIAFSLVYAKKETERHISKKLKPVATIVQGCINYDFDGIRVPQISSWFVLSFFIRILNLDCDSSAARHLLIHFDSSKHFLWAP